MRIVLKGSKIVFFLNMGDEESFTNILDIYKVERITKYILFFYCRRKEELKVLWLKLYGLRK